MMPDPVSYTSLIGPQQPSPKARAAAQTFEAVFIGQMTKLMLESAEPQGGFSGGHGEALFRGVLAEQIGSFIARGGGIGIADSVLAEIVKLQRAGKGGAP